jgi:hypothetical protein
MALHPIYTTHGEHISYFEDGYLFNLSGEWIGFVDTRNGYVYSVLGEYVGYVNKDGRVLRKRSMDEVVTRRAPPPPPKRPRLPSSVPLAPLMGDLSFDTIDVFEDMADRLHTIDSGELKDDMD